MCFTRNSVYLNIFFTSQFSKATFFDTRIIRALRLERFQDCVFTDLSDIQLIKIFL